MKEKGLGHLLWLDLPAVAQSLVREYQDVVAVNYFTTRVGKPEGSVRRQSTYLDALRVRGGINITYGNFIYNDEECKHCGVVGPRREEKQTDVSIAVRLLGDAIDDEYDSAFLVCGDSDQVPAVKEVLLRYPQKRIVVVSPPGRHSDELKTAASATFALSRTVLANCQLPEWVPNPGGPVLYQPAEWWTAETS